MAAFKNDKIILGMFNLDIQIGKETDSRNSSAVLQQEERVLDAEKS